MGSGSCAHNAHTEGDRQRKGNTRMLEEAPWPFQPSCGRIFMLSFHPGVLAALGRVRGVLGGAISVRVHIGFVGENKFFYGHYTATSSKSTNCECGLTLQQLSAQLRVCVWEKPNPEPPVHSGLRVWLFLFLRKKHFRLSIESAPGEKDRPATNLFLFQC